MKNPICKKCQGEFPSKRKELGYTTCVDCSDEKRWSVIPVIHHKTGNEFQVVKDPDVVAEFMAKSQRSGFGTLKGMTGSWRKHINPATAAPEVKILLNNKNVPVIKRIVSPPDPSLYQDEEVAKAFFVLVDEDQVREAVEMLEKEFQSRKISPEARKQLLYTVQQ